MTAGAIVSATVPPIVCRRRAKPNGSVEVTDSGPRARTPRRSVVMVYSRSMACIPEPIAEAIAGKAPAAVPVTPSGSLSTHLPCAAGSGERISTRARTRFSRPAVPMSGTNVRVTRSVRRTR